MKPETRIEDGETPAAIRASLQHILASDSFGSTPQRRKLLAYVVEQTLAGRQGAIKAFELAVAVLGRTDRFDPQTDPIVRIEMGRLRRDLAQYYTAAGRDDPIRIAIPPGAYTATFTAVPSLAVELPTAPSAVRPWPMKRMGIVLSALCLLVAITATIGWAPWRNGQQAQSGPAILVLPFETLAGGEEGRLLASGLTDGVINSLMRYDGLQVFASLPASDGKAALPPAATDALAYVLSGSVQREPDRAAVTTRLTDRASGKVLWSEAYDRTLTPSDIYDMQTDLTAAIVGHLAQDYGVIASAAAAQMRQSRPQTLFAYDCVQRAFAYRRLSSFDDYPAVRACLEEAVERDPNYVGAWAMLAFAHLDGARFGLVSPAAASGELQAGLAAARRAVEIGPRSVLALQSLAALHFGSGDYAEAERIQREVIALNPQNPESLAQLGMRLTIRGQWQEGGAKLQQAIDRSVAVPNWYYTTRALSLYQAGAYEQARAMAEAGKDFCCGVGRAVLALTEGALGHAAAAQGALAEAARQAPLLLRDPRAFWTRFQVSEDVVNRLVEGLSKAGLSRSAVLQGSLPKDSRVRGRADPV